MKKHDEIKQGLAGCKPGRCAPDCPYGDMFGCVQTMHQDTLVMIQQLEAQVPKWRSANEPPERWRMEDKEKTLINYLVYIPEYGVDVGNWLKPAKRWVVVGIPAKVTHWMPLPESPKEDDHAQTD